MVATITTFDSILKDHVVDAVYEQLNNEVIALELFEKSTRKWEGRACVYPIHTARNTTGVNAVGENQALPTAGNQTYEEVRVKAKYLYGRFSVTGPAIASAKKGSSDAVLSYMEAEMDALVRDVRDKANLMTLYGGPFKGFLSEKKAYSVSVSKVSDVTDLTSFTAEVTVQYDGDFSVFEAAGCTTADITTWVRVQLYRLDTYAEILPVDGTSQTLAGIFVTNYSKSAGTVGIRVGAHNAAGTSGVLSTAALDDEVGIALSIHPFQGLDKAASAAIGKLPSYIEGWTVEPAGIAHNLASRYFDFSTVLSASQNLTLIDRSSPSYASLRSTVICQDDNANGVRENLTLTRIQTVLDRCLEASGDEPDVMLMNPRQRQKYLALLQGHITKDASSKPKANGGFSGGLGYGDVDILAHRSVSNGMIFFLKKDTWELAQLEKGQFMDMDGAVLARVSGTDAYEGIYTWYWNLVCQRPNANGALIGLTLT